MTFSYSGDPASSELDKYRFLLGDTDENKYMLSDEELTYILTEHSNHNVRMYHAFSALESKYSKFIKRRLGPQSEDPTGRQKYYADKVAYYKSLCSVSGLNVQRIKSSKVFSKGMHDNV